MKQNYNIKRNPIPPSDAQIAKHRDFDALLEAYQAQAVEPPKRSTSVRRLWIVGSAVAAALLGVIGFSSLFFAGNNNYEAQQQAYFQSQPYINPPLNDVEKIHEFSPNTAVSPNAKFASYKVDASEGGSYKYADATRLIVPSDAFEDENGQLIEGDVNLYYREMHDYIDFFLSGIPMTYDSASLTYNLESAGMVEIYAEKDGRRVRMAKDKSIDIELASVIEVPDINIPPAYNIYKLDTLSRKWVYQEIDHIELLNDWEDLEEADPRKAAQDDYKRNLANIEKDKNSALEALESTILMPTAPEKPKARDKKLQTFDLDFLESFGASDEAKALQEKYQGAIWQVAENSQPIPQNAARLEWDDVDLKPLANNQYQLTLIRTDRQLKLIVEPAVRQSDYQAALAKYEAAQLEYQNQIAARELKIADKRLEILQGAAIRAEKNKADYEGYLKNNNTNVRPVRRKVLNKFKATSLGIWNCDRPIPPMEYEMEVQFVDASTNEIYQNTTGYLVDKSRNTIYRFLVNENTRLKFNQQSENFLWLVTADKEIAIFRPAQFKALDKKVSKHIFELEKIPAKLETEADVRKVLSI